MTDEERKGYRYRKTGMVTVLEEYDGEAEGWYTMATLHEPDESRTGERLVAALVAFYANDKLVEAVEKNNRLLAELNAATPKCVSQSCPNPPYTKSGHCHHHRYLRFD
ncbi:hypothetical protein LCGC14_2052320 [marine sediment metagenome]|uniref:Uncharacterized protein n=1 Tax=marine sediment metagenome TaxID=412755 RepID=A0A0F9ENR3_9ZZZZ